MTEDHATDRDTDARRYTLIAKTESFCAANWTNREAWAQSDMVKRLKFYTAEDDHVCRDDECSPGDQCKTHWLAELPAPHIYTARIKIDWVGERSVH